MVSTRQAKTGLAVLFVLFTVQLLAFVQGMPPVIGRSVMFASLLTALLLSWSRTTLTSVIALTVLAVQFVLPVALAGTIPGIDSWFYIATAQAIAANGWEAAPTISYNASLFPGVQLFGIGFAEVTGATLIEIARVYPLVIKASVPILVIGLYSRWSLNGTRLAALLLVSYSAFLNGFPFHHLTHGIVLLMLGVALLWRWLETCRHRDLFMLAIVWLALLITHQSSTVYWGILATIAITVGVLSWRFEQVPLNNGTVVLFAAGMTAFTYYTWVAPEYLTLAVRFQARFGSAAAEVPFIIRQQLTATPRNAWITSNGLGEEGKKNAAAVVFFAATAVVGLVSLRRRIFNKEWLARPWIEITAYASMGMLALIRLVSVVGVSHLGGTSRVMVAAIPIGLIAMFTTIREESSDISVVLRHGVAAAVVVLLVVNAIAMPTHFLSNDPAVIDEQPKYMTNQWRSGYDWLGHGGDAVVGTQGGIYLRSMTETEPVISYRPYAGDFSQTDAKLLHYRDGYEQELLIRTVPGSFKIPERQAEEYNTQWTKVYSNGDSVVFYSQTNES